MLRVAVALKQQQFESVVLTPSGGGSTGADLTCTKNGQRVCCEIKAITKQSRGGPGLFFEDQLYEKILENISKARRQLAASSAHLGCNLNVLIYVVNWFEQSIYLDQSAYQYVVNKLEEDGEQHSLHGIDGVMFLTATGQVHLFLHSDSDAQKLNDCQ